MLVYNLKVSLVIKLAFKMRNALNYMIKILENYLLKREINIGIIDL